MKSVISDKSASLLVGGSGRVGQMMIAHFEACATPPKVVLQTRGKRLSAKFPSLIWDPLDGPAAVVQWQRDHGPIGCLIVMAGATPGHHVDLSANADIACAAIEACLEAGIPRVLLASSSAVYGAGKNMSEAAPLSPLNPYGEAKRDMEHRAASVAGDAIDLCCLRIGNVAGADALLLNAANASEESPLNIDCFADGCGPRRSYIGPADLSDALLKLSATPHSLPSVLNVGAPAPTDMIDLAGAADAPFTLRDAVHGAVQDVTLDCRAFCDLAMLPAAAAAPPNLVHQWQSLRGRK